MHSFAVRLLQSMVRSPSVSGNERETLEIYAGFAEEAGFEPVTIGRNVYIERRVGPGPALLFNSHVDTVKAGPTWTRDPWDGAIEDGRVHGLGANDAHGSVAAQLGALLELHAEGFEGNVIVCASCDEETGGEGMEVIARTLPPYAAAVIGEPNDLVVATGQRGLVKGTIHLPGRRAHASRPWQGENAIHKVGAVLSALEAPHLNVPDDLTRATVQVTQIEGGTQSNVVPDACAMTVDCRTTPEFDNDAMIEHLRVAAQAAGGRFEVYSDRFRPVHTPRDATVVAAALEATGAAAPTVFPSVCDLFWVAHVPSIVCGPGRPERSHQADEFIRIDEVDRGVAVYAELARRWWARVAAVDARKE